MTLCRLTLSVLCAVTNCDRVHTPTDLSEGDLVQFTLTFLVCAAVTEVDLVHTRLDFLVCAVTGSDLTQTYLNVCNVP